jgi:hypothetical protein
MTPNSAWQRLFGFTPMRIGHECPWVGLEGSVAVEKVRNLPEGQSLHATEEYVDLVKGGHRGPDEGHVLRPPERGGQCRTDGRQLPAVAAVYAPVHLFM